MKLHKVDTTAWTVREVTGEPWPGKDSDGETCYENTHFVEPVEAWEKLQKEAEAWVQIAARDVKRVRSELQKYEQDAVEAALALEKVISERRKTPNVGIEPPKVGSNDGLGPVLPKRGNDGRPRTPSHVAADDCGTGGD